MVLGARVGGWGGGWCGGSDLGWVGWGLGLAAAHSSWRVVLMVPQCRKRLAATSVMHLRRLSIVCKIGYDERLHCVSKY